MIHEKVCFQIDQNMLKENICYDIYEKITVKWKFYNHIIHFSRKSDNSNLFKSE